EPFLKLVRALQGRDVAPTVLIDLCRSADVVLRRAAVQGARGRSDPELLAAVGALVADPDDLVRVTLAEALADVPDWPLDRAVERLLRDGDDEVRIAAAKAARRRPGVEAVLL